MTKLLFNKGSLGYVLVILLFINLLIPQNRKSENYNAPDVTVYFEYYNDGSLLWEKSYLGKENKKVRMGKWTKYHKNGNKWTEGYYKHGQKVGSWTEWNENGSIKQVEIFIDKEKSNLTIYKYNHRGYLLYELNYLHFFNYQSPDFTTYKKYELDDGKLLHGEHKYYIDGILNEESIRTYEYGKEQRESTVRFSGAIEDSLGYFETVTYLGVVFELCECKAMKNYNQICIRKDYYEDGSILWEKSYNGFRHGISIKYHENGRKWYEGGHDYGHKVGEWTEWYENGQVKQIETYINVTDSYLKKFTYYFDGTVESEQSYFFYQTNNKRQRTKHGKWIYYNKDGSFQKEETYKDGELID